MRVLLPPRDDVSSYANALLCTLPYDRDDNDSEEAAHRSKRSSAQEEMCLIGAQRSGTALLYWKGGEEVEVKKTFLRTHAHT